MQNIENIKQEFDDLEKKLISPEVVNNVSELKKISKRHSELKNVILLINKKEKLEKEITEGKEILKNDDQELKELAEEEIKTNTEKLKKIEEELNEELNPDDPNNTKNAIIEIRAGTGGDESALFAAELFRAYSRFAENNNFKINILNSNQIGIGGFKEIVFEINGKNAYGNMKFEAGTHRVQRIPETEKQGRVHTSAVTVVVLPEAEEIDLEIKQEDLKIDVYRSSGPGGQSVNTTDSAIRITYLPTGLVVQCQDQKSQHQNKDKAMQILRSRLLAQIEAEKQEKESTARKNQVGSGDRSDKIRTYNFPQDRITDHRIKKNWHSIDKIMNGEINNIIEELKAFNKKL